MSSHAERTLDPSLFQLSDQEKEWALEIKQAIEDLPDLDVLSDFMCVNLAIAGKGSVDWALDRAYKMQETRKEYNIALTYEEGKRALQKLAENIPCGLLSYDFDLHTGKCTLVLHFAESIKASMRDPRKADEICRGVHYLCYSTFPSLESVRVGNLHIFECEGWDMRMARVENIAKITNSGHDCFPSNVITHFYHTSSMTNVVLAMVKKLVSKDVACKWKFGLKFYAAGATTLCSLYV
ncbi:unknown protein [Seminavis robusta]|uniref:Uncharacterized protein n=1 Tax=Seminavis robusta TaxID=568900 RepID=A0A9N8DJD7_9STRA|nr:unknown protein [Seminavis robusta]|eukprot:Sro116_g057140.1 n/a (238) ;mRNA; r:76054-76767